VADQRCRVTVIGDTRRVNVAVPASAPIAEYVGMLAQLCGQPEDDAFPAVWSLAEPGRPAYSVTNSLDSVGALDGQVLYLRDTAIGEADEIIVVDLEEMVEDATQPFERWAWTRETRAATGLAFGECWLVATLVAVAVAGAPQADHGLLAALALGCGVVSASLVMAARRRRWPLSPALQFGLALSVLPDMAIAGRFAASADAGPPTVVLAAAVGLMLGSLFCVSAIPATVMVPVPVLAFIGLAATVLLSEVGANGAESASVVVVVALGLTSLAPQAIGALVASSPFERRASGGHDPASESEATLGQVKRGWWLLAVVNMVLAVALGIALVVLAGSPNVFAVALAACGSVALVVRAGTRRYLTEILPTALAGAAGILALLLQLPHWLHGAAWSGAVAAVTAGFLLLLAGLVASLRSGQPGGWRGFLNLVGVLTGIASVPLMLGVFGLFRYLETLGHHL
jgi:type VII secretion integral membrane protein EccD